MQTFDNYYYSNEGKNELTVSVIKKIAESYKNGSDTDSHLYTLYGPHNSGKTHLMKALFNEVSAFQIPAIYLKMDDFFEGLIGDLRANRNGIYFKSICENKLIIIDDIYWCVNKEFIQQKLYELISLAVDQKKCIIVSTNDRYSLTEHSESLYARIENGIYIRLTLCRNDELKSFFNNYISELQLIIDDELRDYILKKYSTIPVLRGILKLLSYIAELKNTDKITFGMIEEYI